MSISSQLRRIQYTLASTNQALSFPYYFLANGDLAVVKTDSDGIDTTLTITTHYTVSGAGVGAGGTVTMVGATVGDIITIYGAMAQTQPQTAAYQDQEPSAARIQAYDRLTMLVQQLMLNVKRALRFPVTNAEGGEMSVIDRAGRLLGFDTDGDVDLSNSPTTLIAAAVAQAKLTATPVYMSNGVNVLSFGATGNGVTDDSVAITAAIAAAVAIGGSVYFPAGTYLVSRQGTFATLGYGAGTIPYAFRISSPISLIGDGPKKTKFLVPMNTGSNANLFLFTATQECLVSGISAERATASTGTGLYGGALVATDQCKNVVVDNCTTKNMRGLATFFGSEDCRTHGCIAEKSTGIYSGTHFGSYASHRCSFIDSTCYGGANDGDIVHFGVGTGNQIIGCQALNYLRTDATKAIALTTAQGIIFDTGQARGLIQRSLAYGYYYGFDIKSSCEHIMVAECFAHKNKVGIAVRRGETNEPTLNTTIRGCSIIPDGGNGEATAVVDSFAVVGIYLQDAFGTIIEGNTIGKTYFDTTANDTFLCLGETRTNFGDASTMGWTKIVNNKFLNQANYGGNNRFNANKFISMAGTSGSLKNVLISGNDFKGVFVGDITYDFMTLSQIQGLTITNNNFGSLVYGTTGSTGTAIRITNVSRANISCNFWAAHGQVLRATTCTGLTFSTNMLQLGQQGSTVPMIYLDAVAGFIFTSNNYYFTGVGFNDGRPIDSVNTPAVANYIFANNVFEQTNFDATNWYRIDGAVLAVRADLIDVNNLL